MPPKPSLPPVTSGFRRATTLAETLVVIAVVAVAGGVILGIGSAVWKVVKSWQ